MARGCNMMFNNVNIRFIFFFFLSFSPAMELFLPEKRVLYYSILECFLPVGAIMVALIASWVKDWRLLLQVSNVPGLLFLSYFWFVCTRVRQDLLTFVVGLRCVFFSTSQADRRVDEMVGDARQT